MAGLQSTHSTRHHLEEELFKHLGIEAGDSSARFPINLQITLADAFNLPYSHDGIGSDVMEQLTQVLAVGADNLVDVDYGADMSILKVPNPIPLDLSRHFDGVVAICDARCSWIMTPHAIVRREVAIAHGFSGPDQLIAEHLRAGHSFMAVRRHRGTAPEIVGVKWSREVVRGFKCEPISVAPLSQHEMTVGGVGGLYPSELFASPCHAEFDADHEWCQWGAFDGTDHYNLHVPATWARAFQAYSTGRFGISEHVRFGDANVVVFDSVNPLAVLRGAYDGVDHCFDDDEHFCYWTDRHQVWRDGVRVPTFAEWTDWNEREREAIVAEILKDSSDQGDEAGEPDDR